MKRVFNSAFELFFGDNHNYPNFNIGKYLIFSPNRNKLVEIAIYEIENNGFIEAKISIESRNGDFVLCLYYKDDSRLNELARKYDYDDVRVVKFKTDEETMKPLNEAWDKMYNKFIKDNPSGWAIL